MEQCPLLETINSQLLISSRDEGLQKRICQIEICLSVSVKENGYPSQRFLLLKKRPKRQGKQTLHLRENLRYLHPVCYPTFESFVHQNLTTKDSDNSPLPASKRWYFLLYGLCAEWLKNLCPQKVFNVPVIKPWNAYTPLFFVKVSIVLRP